MSELIFNAKTRQRFIGCKLGCLLELNVMKDKKNLLDTSAKDLIVLLEKVEEMIRNNKGEAQWVMDEVVCDKAQLLIALKAFRESRMQHYLRMAYAQRQKRDALGRFSK